MAGPAAARSRRLGHVRLEGPDGVVVVELRPGQDRIFALLARSYGGNNRMPKLNRDDSGKVLLLDYNKILADVIGPNARDVWLRHNSPRGMTAR